MEGGHLQLQGAERGHGGLWGTRCLAVGVGAGGQGSFWGGGSILEFGGGGYSGLGMY